MDYEKLDANSKLRGEVIKLRGLLDLAIREKGLNKVVKAIDYYESLGLKFDDGDPEYFILQSLVTAKSALDHTNNELKNLGGVRDVGNN